MKGLGYVISCDFPPEGMGTHSRIFGCLGEVCKAAKHHSQGLWIQVTGVELCCGQVTYLGCLIFKIGIKVLLGFL